MTNPPDTDPTPHPAGPPPTDGPTYPGAPAPGQFRRFRRSRTDRVLTGVCGGLGEATGVDPVVYRVLIAVLAFFGGAGLLVYGACWLLMPEADKDTSLADEALAKGRGKSPNARLVLGIVFGIVALAALTSIGYDGRASLLVALFALAVVLLTRRQGGAGPDAPAAPGAAWSLNKPAPPDHGGPAYSSATSAGEAYPTGTYSAYPPPASVPVPPPGAAPWPPPPPWPQPPKPPRERSILGRLTFGLVLLGLGILAAADLAGAHVAAAAYPALVLAIAGLGLLLGTFVGRARGLIALGILAALALPPAAFTDAFDGSWSGRDRLIRPVDTAGIATDYSYGAGRIRLDLSGVDFNGTDISTHVQLGAGDLEITLPKNVDVNVDLELGIGDATVFDSHNSGLGVSRSRGDTGLDGVGGGNLHLKVGQGIGRVEVRRATA
jgi:phage shock protein PspC (stress-responsive transcriptional regulator)